MSGPRPRKTIVQLKAPSSVNSGPQLFEKKILHYLKKKNKLPFLDGEFLIYHFHNTNGPSDKKDKTKNCILLTNLRIARMGNGEVASKTLFSEIVDIKLEGSTIHNDKLILKLSSGPEVLVPIASHKVGQFFLEAIKEEMAGLIEGSLEDHDPQGASGSHHTHSSSLTSSPPILTPTICITVVSATNLGSATHPPSPFVNLALFARGEEYGNQKGGTIENAINPVFNQTFYFKMASDESQLQLELELFNAKKSKPVSLGYGSVDISMLTEGVETELSCTLFTRGGTKIEKDRRHTALKSMDHLPPHSPVASQGLMSAPAGSASASPQPSPGSNSSPASHGHGGHHTMKTADFDDTHHLQVHAHGHNAHTASLFLKAKYISAAWIERQQYYHFGRKLDQLQRVYVEGYQVPIPRVLVVMGDYLVSHHGLQCVGIFRVNADSKLLDQVKEQLNRNFESATSTEMDPNIIASLIKLWFRECPDYFLADIDFQTCEDAESAGNVVNSMPEPRLSIFLWLLDLALAVAEKEEQNKMNIDSMAIVLAPNLVKERKDQDDPERSLKMQHSVCKFLLLALNYRKAHPTKSTKMSSHQPPPRRLKHALPSVVSPQASPRHTLSMSSPPTQTASLASPASSNPSTATVGTAISADPKEGDRLSLPDSQKSAVAGSGEEAGPSGNAEPSSRQASASANLLALAVSPESSDRRSSDLPDLQPDPAPHLNLIHLPDDSEDSSSEEEDVGLMMSPRHGRGHTHENENGREHTHENEHGHENGPNNGNGSPFPPLGPPPPVPDGDDHPDPLSLPPSLNVIISSHDDNDAVVLGKPPTSHQNTNEGDKQENSSSPVQLSSTIGTLGPNTSPRSPPALPSSPPPDLEVFADPSDRTQGEKRCGASGCERSGHYNGFCLKHREPPAPPPFEANATSHGHSSRHNSRKFAEPPIPPPFKADLPKNEDHQE